MAGGNEPNHLPFARKLQALSVVHRTLAVTVMLHGLPKAELA
jgi:hypothetical protein